MSLQAWYPFDGNINNYGVGALNLTQTTAPTYSTSGKLGARALATGGFKWTAAQSAAILNNNAISFAFWIKALNTTSGQIFGTSGMNANNNRKFAIFAYPTGNDLHLSWMNDAASTTFMGGVVTGVFPVNAWTHCCITYHNPTLTVYINGEVKYTATGTSSSSSFEYETPVIHNSANRLIQDFRVYNHCLSPREVKMISQGLILHMPLKDTDGEETINLAPYPTPGSSATASYDWDKTLHANAINVSGWAVGYNGGVGTPTSGYHAHWELIDGLPTMVFPDLNSYLSLGHRWLGINAGSMQSKIGPSTTYTISFDARADVHNMFLRTGYHYRVTGAASNAFHDGYGDFYLSTQWKRYSCTFTTKSTLDTAIGASIYFYGHNGSVNGTSYVRNVQIELKDHATAYTKNTRTSTLMDCSGYGRHGSGVGTIITNPDSARYDNCIYISDGRSNYGKSGSLTMPTDKITMSCWIKTYATGYGNYHIPLSFNSANYELSIDASGHFRNGFTIGGTRSVLTTSHTSILDGKWHMITATYDGATIRRYVDGNELTSYSTAIVGSLAGGTDNLLIGNYDGTTYGNKEAYMSDVRVYATALSTEDIKTLYQTRISMLDNGATTAYEYKEGELNNIKFTEEGLARVGNISEVGYIGGMKTKVLPDGSAWARIHWLDLEFDKTVFANDDEVAFCDKPNRFSRMGLVDHFIGKHFSITNLMPAVNTTNYTGGTADTTYKKYSNASLKLVGTTSAHESYLKTTQTIPYEPGHTYYCRCDILQETVQGSCDMYWKIAEPYVMGGKAATTAKTWARASQVRPASTIINRNGADWTADSYQARWDYNNSKVAGNMWFDGMMLIDLTATFGAGKEPTAAWCDVNIPYFVGTQTITINDDSVGWYEFMLTYPKLSATGYNRWRQTNSPNVAANAGANHIKITTAWSKYSSPITKSASSGSATYSMNSANNWWAPIGQKVLFSSTGIPAADGSTQLETELWVRIDTLPAITKLSLLDNKYIQATEIYEI